MISSELSAAVRVASDALSQNPEGRLSLPHRRRIRQLFGPFLRKEGTNEEGANEDGLPEGPGYRRRARLSILCVQYVLPVWDAAFPDESHSDGASPQRMLETCEGLLRGQVVQEKAWQESQRFWSVLEDILPTEPVASYVGYASVKATGVAGDDDDPEASLEENDRALTPDEWDDSYYADLAASGGEPGQDNSSNQKRREFWQWYLEQAVPKAYESVSD